MERNPRAYTPRHLADKILTSRGALEGERKHVTVLFADLKDSTQLAGGVDPEDWHGTMDRCFKLILDQVHRYQGTVNQFLGDGVMALFGAPVALEEAPRCAVLAALRIQSSLEALRRELRQTRGIDFRMRIGIHSGLVVVGKIGDDLRMDYTAVGDTTNVAARLEELAEPGTILISEATERLLSGFFDVEDRGELQIKGHTRPVRAYEVIAERPVRGRLDAIADRGLTPFIGREHELEALRTSFESARQGHGQVVFLVGEAGIGKSRLRLEFRRSLGAEPHTWVEGRCTSFGGATFLPIIDGLQRLFEIEDGDEDATATGKVQRGVERFGQDLGWTLPYLHQLLSLRVEGSEVADLDAATRRSETFRALTSVFLQAAQQQPLVFVVEDLHWIDPASEEFLRVLADAVPATRVLLLLTHRTGYRHPFGDRSYHVRVALQALTESQTAAMAGAVLETANLPEDLHRLIAQKAEGNPFFVEEVTKSLHEEGALRVVDGRVELTRDLAQISVPDSIQDVLMARIDRLPEEPKRAIQVASVIGREFALRLLQRISEVGERVQGVVSELRSLELVYEMAADPELSFRFKHALTCDVAYESILHQRRRELHILIGTTIEDLYQDRLPEHYETLAHHFGKGEDWDRALLYHERAAEKATEAFANHSARKHCHDALAIVERLERAVSNERLRRLEEMLGTACLYLSEFVASGDAFIRAAAASEQPTDRGVNFGKASYWYLWGKSYKRAEETAGQAIEVGRAHNAHAGQAIGILTGTYMQALLEGEMEPYEHSSRDALRLGERAENEEAVGLALFSQGEIAEWKGDYRRAVSLLESSVAIGRRLRIPYLIVWGVWFIGKATCCLGEYSTALAQIQEALGLSDRIGDRAWKSRLFNTLGWCLGELGHQERARTCNEQAVSIAREIDDDELLANAEINLAGNHLRLGELDRAIGYLEPIRAGLESREPWMRWRYTLHLLDTLAQVALVTRDPEQALELADQELAGARKHHARKIEARALELRGRLLLTLDRREEAASTLSEALATADRIGHPPVILRAHSSLAELDRRLGNLSASESHLARRQALADRLAKPLTDTELREAFQTNAARLVLDEQ